MNYSTPLLEAKFLKRYKRFFADVELNGKKVVAHVPNTGSLKGICDQPRLCRISPAENPERKLKYTLEQVQTESSWVGVNTHKANDLVWEAFEKKIIPHWQDFIDGAREVKITPETRLDFKFLTKKNKPHFVEVKSVTLIDHTSNLAHKKGTALFPDAETTRGQKHIVELMRLIDEGATCELLYVVQRTDCTKFSPADLIDARYGQLLREAHKKGVLITPLQVSMSDKKIELTDQILSTHI